jgi:tetratricopeptide (TPR) repeat protein
MHDQVRTNLPVIDHAHLLIELHRLIAAGKGDDAEADDVRDAMDVSWYQLRAEEIDAVNGLSADLYSIGQNRKAYEKPTAAFMQDLQGRVVSGDWHEVLTLVREHESILPPERVAMLRGLAWANLQLFEPAIEFLQEAMRLSPNNKDVRLLLLSCLVQAGRTNEAVRLAAESTDQSTLELASST